MKPLVVGRIVTPDPPLSYYEAIIRTNQDLTWEHRIPVSVRPTGAGLARVLVRGLELSPISPADARRLAAALVECADYIDEQAAAPGGGQPA